MARSTRIIHHNQLLQGRIQDFFFRRGCTLLLVYFNTNKPHSFFLQNTSCVRKLQVISGWGGGVHPLHPPPRSAPLISSINLIGAKLCSSRPCSCNLCRSCSIEFYIIIAFNDDYAFIIASKKCTKITSIHSLLLLGFQPCIFFYVKLLTPKLF